MRAWTLCCFHSLIGTQTFRRALTASVDSCAETKSAFFSGVTSSGRVWRKVPESEARSAWGRTTIFTRPGSCVAEGAPCLHSRCPAIDSFITTGSLANIRMTHMSLAETFLRVINNVKNAPEHQTPQHVFCFFVFCFCFLVCFNCQSVPWRTITFFLTNNGTENDSTSEKRQPDNTRRQMVAELTNPVETIVWKRCRCVWSQEHLPPDLDSGRWMTVCRWPPEVSCSLRWRLGCTPADGTGKTTNYGTSIIHPATLVSYYNRGHSQSMF